MKRPSFPFYPGDYLRDAAVRALSLEARGLWVDMLCLMHQAPRRGYLELAIGVPIDEAKLSRMVGDSVNRVSNLISEMRLTGVFSEENGVIFSRRMVRDERRIEVNTENGKKGGNPQVKGVSVNRNSTEHSTDRLTTPVNGSVGSSSSSFSSSKKHTVLSKEQSVWFDEWWAFVWSKVGRGAAEKAFAKMVRDLQTADAVIDATKKFTVSLSSKDPQYWPHPSTWLNAKRWLDEVSTAKPAPTSDLPLWTPADMRREQEARAAADAEFDRLHGGLFGEEAAQ